MGKTPETIAEWQDAADAAYAMLALDSAQKYGLAVGGPGIDVERCSEILVLAETRGVRPRLDAVERLMAEIFETKP